ncbi:MAG: pyridine nucleotide transhydrogenase [Pandoraea sp.]|nr:pyridine nucleotide transhydrogenase [Pandoraea sp.]MDR3396776.1 pyridine nucleotide transhydrogenase [Pandoraea sp.]
MARVALIGFTGFVGSTLLRQCPTEHRFRANNIHEIQGESYDLVLCAGAPGQKWLANREPDADRNSIQRLISALGDVRAKTFVLLSTVDVFQSPVGVDEATVVDTNGLQPYGLHRYELESFVREQFQQHLVVRLPGLVGPGLRKNVIYDMAHDNNIAQIDPRGVYQFYPVVNLWSDIRRALKESLPLVHLTAEPLGTEEIASSVFGRQLAVPQAVEQRPPMMYDVRSTYGQIFGAGDSQYQYSKRESLLAIRAYAQNRQLQLEATKA